LLSKATQILNDISAGDLSQRELLFQEVYDDFRRLAQQYVAREEPERDLQATEVVHEVYLRLIDQTRVSWKDRSHFFATGAHIMRHVLVDHARKRLAQKRGGGAAEVSMDLVDHLIRISPESDADVLSVHEAIEKLAQSNERQAQLVELRFFGGLTVGESAVAVGVSPSTAEREWRVAKAWLRRELS
jgi:RNA polymerase sigma factor (TIGR02999 family)